MKRVTGLGGVFFKTEDPKKIKAWYEKHLGMNMDEYGFSFRWKDLDNPDANVPALTAWSPFKEDTTYFSPSKKQFMFNSDNRHRYIRSSHRPGIARILHGRAGSVARRLPVSRQPVLLLV